MKRVLSWLLVLVLFALPCAAWAEEDEAFFGDIDDDDWEPSEAPMWLTETYLLPGMGAFVLDEGNLGWGRSAKVEDGTVNVDKFCIFADDPSEYASVDEMLRWCMFDDKCHDEQIVHDEQFSTKFGAPSYLISWTSGAGDDLRKNLSLVVLTDEYRLMYEFSAKPDVFDGLKDEMDKVLDGLTIVETGFL